MAHVHEHTNGECCHGHGCGCEHSHEDIDKGQFLFKLIGGGFFLIAGYILNEIAERGIVNLPKFTYLVCFMLSYLIVGFDIIKEAVEGVIHKDIFNENLLMTIASIGAFAVGEYSEGCMVVFLFTIGEYLQGLALEKSRKSIKNMLEAKTEEVNILVDGKEQTVKPDEVKVDDLMIIRPGEKLHEIMVTTEDSATTYEYDKHFIVYPQVVWNDKQKINESGRKVEDGFSYSSGNNTEWLSVEDIRKLLETLDLEK